MPNVFLEAMYYSYLRQGSPRKVAEELEDISTENIEICFRYDSVMPGTWWRLGRGPLMLLASRQGFNIQLESTAFMPALM